MDKSWIDRYFEGDLNADEEEALRLKLAADPEFRKEWEYQQAVKQSIHRKERAELKGFLQEVEARRGGGKMRVLTGAAAILILLTGIWFYFLRDNSQVLAQAYFQPLPNMVSPVVRSTDPAPEEAGAAFRAYEAADYTGALREFNKIEKPYAVLYRGISYLALDSTEAALRILGSFSAADNGLPLETYRKWYLGLAFLKNGEKEKAKAIFTGLTAYANPVRERAEKLLKELR